MIVTHKINMNLDRAGVMPRVDVVQGDANTREIQFCLFSGGQVWTVPADVRILIRYRKPTGAGGTYDKLPEGTSAAAVSGNVVTVTLAPQALATPGITLLALTMVQGENELSTFSIALNVVKNPTAVVSDEGSYVSVSGMLPIPGTAKVGQIIAVSEVAQDGVPTKTEAIDPPTGGASEEQIAAAVEEYMAANPCAAGATIYYTTLTINDELADSIYPFIYTDMVPNDRIPKEGDLIIDPVNRLYKIVDVYGDPYFTADAAWIATLSKDGTGGSSVQPDWNQNDETAADYVKNRTHWSEPGLESLFSADLEMAPRDDIDTGTMINVASDPITLEFEADKTYVVMWNGVSYECLCQRKDFYTSNTNGYDWYIGNLEFVGNYHFAAELTNHGAGMPFLIRRTWERTSFSEENKNNVFMAGTEPVTVSVDILSDGIVHHPLDEKYIPESIARKTATLPMPATASVGQYIVVSAVDESGKVTATEAVTLADAEEVAF